MSSPQYFGQIPQDLVWPLSTSEQYSESHLNIEIHESLESTNSRAHEVLKTLKWRQHQYMYGFICADQQTAGRGRLNRVWWSPAQRNIYVSYMVSLPGDYAFSGLSLAVGLSVRQVLQAYCAQSVSVKWPNDVIVCDQKIAGILIEVYQRAGRWWFVIGVGLNVGMTEDEYPEAHRPWTSLALLVGSPLCRITIIKQLQLSIDQTCQQFAKAGWPSFLSSWRAADWLYGQYIRLNNGVSQLQSGTLFGLASGVDESGQLLVLDDQQQLHSIVSAEIELILAKTD